MSNTFFSEDNYSTAPGRERLLHRLLFRSRVYYIMRFIFVVFRYWPAARKRSFYFETWRETSFRVFRIMEDCGGCFNIKGLLNIQRTEGPVVFVANHMSTMETLVLICIIFPHKRPAFVVKEQLLSIPFFKAYLKKCIGVTRKSPSEDFKQVMTRGSEMISKGYSIIVFPQARRSMTIDPSRFNTLGIKLARRNNVPVIPIALKTDFWKDGKILKDFGPLDQNQPIHFEFGAPKHIKGSGKEEHKQIILFIKSRLDEWGK